MATSKVKTLEIQPKTVPKVNNMENFPQISSGLLFDHIQNLNFRRDNNGERSRTRIYMTKELEKIGWKPAIQKFNRGFNIFAEGQGSNKDAGAILICPL